MAKKAAGNRISPRPFSPFRRHRRCARPVAGDLPSGFQGDYRLEARDLGLRRFPGRPSDPPRRPNKPALAEPHSPLARPLPGVPRSSSSNLSSRSVDFPLVAPTASGISRFLTVGLPGGGLGAGARQGGEARAGGSVGLRGGVPARGRVCRRTGPTDDVNSVDGRERRTHPYVLHHGRRALRPVVQSLVASRP